MKRFAWLLLPFMLSSSALGNGEIYSPNMNLPVPTVGVTTGPTYATDINTSLGIIDSHDHSAGHGVPVTPSGLNLTSDLTFQSHNLTSVRAARFTSQASPITAVTPDLNEIYVSGTDLYYNDGSGNQVRITQSGSVAGATGTITGLPSGTAGAAFSGSTFTFSQATSTAANVDAGTYVLRYPGSYPTPAGNYIALQAPTTLATGFALTLPNSLPGTTGFWMTSTTGGALSWTGVDNSSLQYSSNVVSIKALGVATTSIADGAVTIVKRGSVGQQLSSSCGSFSTANGSLTDVTNLTVTITTYGHPVELMIIPDGSSSAFSYVGVADTASGTVAEMGMAFVRASSVIATTRVYTQADNAAGTLQIRQPPSFVFIDPVAAGTYTYKVQAYLQSGTVALVNSVKLIAFEL